MTVEITAKRGGKSGSASTTTIFTLAQQGDTRQIRGVSRRKVGLAATYKLEGDQLVLSGSAAVLGAALPLDRIAFRRASADGEGVPTGDAPKAGDTGLSNANKLPADVLATVQAAIADNRLAEVDIRGFTLGRTDKDKFRDIYADGGVLIGFEVGLNRFAPGVFSIQALRPIFLTQRESSSENGRGVSPQIPLRSRPSPATSSAACRSGPGSRYLASP